MTDDKLLPWAENVADAEFVARCRAMRAVVFMTLGEHAPVFLALRAAEKSPGALLLARRCFDALPAAEKRHISSNYLVCSAPRSAEDDAPRLSTGRR